MILTFIYQTRINENPAPHNILKKGVSPTCNTLDEKNLRWKFSVTRWFGNILPKLWKELPKSRQAIFGHNKAILGHLFVARVLAKMILPARKSSLKNAPRVKVFF